MKALGHRRSHQRMVRGVKLHLVGTAAKAVMRSQLRRVQVGQARVGLHGLAAQAGPKRRQICGRQLGRVETQRVFEALVGLKEVVTR